MAKAHRKSPRRQCEHCDEYSDNVALIEIKHMCGNCSGTGEGMWDGGTCTVCRGSGEVITEMWLCPVCEDELDE